MSLEIWVPQSARQKRLLCHMCRREYPEKQRPQFERHLKKCVSRHIGEIDQELARRESNVFQSHADPEQYKFWRQRAVERKEKNIRGIE